MMVGVKEAREVFSYVNKKTGRSVASPGDLFLAR
jgi:hypothetical protein